MLFRLIVLVIVSLVVSGCTTLVRLEPIKGPDQALHYERGDGKLTSNRSRSTVKLVADEAEYEERTWLRFSTSILNLGEDSVDVSEESVVANVDGHSAHVLTAATLARKAETSAFWAKIAVGMEGDRKEQEAERAAHMQVNGSIRSASGYQAGSFSGSIYDESSALEAKDRIREETNYKREQVDALLQSRLDQVQNFALQRHTLNSGEKLDAFFVIEFSKGKGPERQIQIDVNVGDDKHTFWFRQVEL